MTDFFVGQKVVCVDDSFSESWSVVPHKPTRGAVYTIREIVLIDFESEADVVCVRLAEIINRVERWTGGDVMEIGFWANRFKPLETEAIEIFRKIAQDVTDGKVVEIADA